MNLTTLAAQRRGEGATWTSQAHLVSRSHPATSDLNVDEVNSDYSINGAASLHPGSRTRLR